MRFALLFWAILTVLPLRAQDSIVDPVEPIPPLLEGCDPLLPIEEYNTCFWTGIQRHIGRTFVIPRLERDAFSAVHAQWAALPKKVRKNTPEPMLEGRIWVAFVVEKDGSVNEIQVVRMEGGLMKETEEAAMDAVRSLRFIRSGLQNDEPVGLKFTVPLSIRML
ncbi:MAG: energy transducer TonB [Schleiferiaceae bacterium]